jgi:hypothetical protein
MLRIYGNIYSPDAFRNGANERDRTMTKQTTVTVTYESVVTTIKAAVKDAERGAGKLRTAGDMLASFYLTRDAVSAVKAQVVADCIVPAFSKDERDILAADIPRKVKGVDDSHDDARKMRKAAQDKIAQYWARLLDYGFGKVEKAKPGPQDRAGDDEGEEATASAKSADVRLSDLLADALRIAQSAEDPTFDIVAFVAAIKSAQGILAAE